MKRYQDVKLVTDTKALVEYKCDLCGKDANIGFGRADWGEKSHYNVAETTVEMSFGKTYPEGSNYTKVECDICCTCFATKLKPWLEVQGVTFRETEVD
jgi:hypothetical protein